MTPRAARWVVSPVPRSVVWLVAALERWWAVRLVADWARRPRRAIMTAPAQSSVVLSAAVPAQPWAIRSAARQAASSVPRSAVVPGRC